MYQRATHAIGLAALVASAGCERSTSLEALQIPEAIADLYVSPTGDDSEEGTVSTLPLATVGRAVELAAEREDATLEDPVEIVIVAGTYDETVRIPTGTYVSLAGGYDDRDPFAWVRLEDPGDTTIIGDAGPALLVKHRGLLVAENLTLRGGPGMVEDLSLTDLEEGFALGGSLTGGVVVAGGYALISDAVVEGGAGDIEEARVAVGVVAVVEEGKTIPAVVVIEGSTLSGGFQCAESAGLYCGAHCTCEVRECPIIEGGTLSRNAIGDRQNSGTSHAITAFVSRSLVAADNGLLTGSEGNFSSAIWAWGVDELKIQDNDRILAGDALTASVAIVLRYCEDFEINGNGVIQGGGGDLSCGIEVVSGNGVVAENLFITGGTSRSYSGGVVVFDGDGTAEVEVRDNLAIEGGSAGTTVGVEIYGSVGGQIVGNASINGGIADRESYAVRAIAYAYYGHAPGDLLIHGNNLYGGTGGISTGLHLRGVSPVVTNNGIVVNGGSDRLYGVLLGDGYDAETTAPLLAFNTILTAAATSLPDSITHRPFGAVIVDAGSSGEAIGNLLVAALPRATLLWLLDDTVSSAYPFNALAPYGYLDGEESYFLLLGEDPTVPALGSVPTTANLATVNDHPAIDGSLSCHPAISWPNAYYRFGDLHQGADNCAEVPCTYDCTASTCADNGPALATIVSQLAEGGFPFSAEWFTDIDGDPRPQGGAMDFGADECVAPD